MDNKNYECPFCKTMVEGRNELVRHVNSCNAKLYEQEVQAKVAEDKSAFGVAYANVMKGLETLTKQAEDYNSIKKVLPASYTAPMNDKVLQSARELMSKLTGKQHNQFKDVADYSTNDLSKLLLEIFGG